MTDQQDKKSVDLFVLQGSYRSGGLLLALDPSRLLWKEKAASCSSDTIVLLSYITQTITTIYNEWMKSIYFSSISIPYKGLELFLSILQKLSSKLKTEIRIILEFENTH